MVGETEGTAYNTQDLAPSIECTAFGWQHFVGDTGGCQFRLDPSQDATLHSCSKGGIEIVWNGGTIGRCAIFIPNQTVPVAYSNGPEDAFLEVLFAGTAFTADVTEAKGPGCFLHTAEDEVARLSANYKVQAAGADFWFDPYETLPSDFHAAASSTIEGAPVDGLTTFKVASETVECQIGDVAGEFPGSASSATLGDLTVAPATGSCASSSWASGVSVDATDCSYAYHSDGIVDLKSCNSGGIVVSWKIPFVVRCKVLIANQNGAGEATYRNHGEDGLLGVRATTDVGLSGEVTESGGYCPYKVGQTLGVTQEGVVDFLAGEGATELWFG